MRFFICGLESFQMTAPEDTLLGSLTHPGSHLPVCIYTNSKWWVAGDQ